MKHDPFYNQIINGLKGKLDPDLFEECVIELIRRYDGYFAVPILGGQDGGMDGAVADGEGEPFPVITTTGKDVIGNMTKNLERYVAEGGERRKCIVATSQSLNSKRRKNLREKAAELEFTFTQILEQSGIAARLYRDPQWCKELLHLTGNPSALSVIPLTRRPLPNHKLVGREEVMGWLQNTEEDRLLVGEPGAGKTSLLYQLAQDEEQRALFIVDKDQTKIANAIREQQPKILMLDDAHINKDFIGEMIRLRREIHADFSLIVTCWNGERKEIESILHTHQQNIYQLKRLTQDQMVQVIAEAGIEGVNWLVREIVRQAEGLAGLAVTLTYLALQGGVKKIHNAEALSSTLLTFYVNRIHEGVRVILACFALGGESGMHKDTVANKLDINQLELYRTLANLASGGIIAEVRDRTDHITDYIKVRPEALRHALIGEVFFSGAAALSESTRDFLLDQTPNLIDTTTELIGVEARGYNVPVPLLKAYLQYLPTAWSVWERYAWLSPHEAAWVIENFHANLSLLAHPLLQHVPQRAIPKLLDEAINDNRELHSNPEHPLRLLQDWVKSAYPREKGATVSEGRGVANISTSDAIRRRALILRSAKKWLIANQDPVIGCKAMLFAMIPHFEDVESDPGSGNTMTLLRGYLTDYELLELQSFWKEIIDCANDVDVPNWEEFLNTIRNWAYPGHARLSDEAHKILTSFAKEMALDVKQAASDHIGALCSLRDLVNRLYPDIEIAVADEINILYPIEKLENKWKEQEDKWQKDADKLADKWIEREPKEVIAQLESIEHELNNRRRYPRLTPYLCYRLAEKTQNPILWIDAMLAATLPSDTAAPFLREAVKRETDGWRQTLRSCFQTDRLKANAIQIILTQENAPDDLKQDALNAAYQFPDVLEQLLWSNQLSQAVIRKLFNHPNKSLVGRLAVTEWQRKPKATIASWIRPLWEQAIIEYCEDDDYWLGEIFSAEKELGIKWLKRKFEDTTFMPFQYKRSIENIIAGLNLEERLELLNIVPDKYFYHSIISKLVGNDPALYKSLLQSSRAESYLLSPLHRPILDSAWVEFAKLASQHGYATEQIVEYTFIAIGKVFSWSGNYSEVWKNWGQKFKAVIEHEDETIRHIAARGLQISSKRYEEERKKEHDAEVYGRD